jgi:hypothetical protein
MHLPIMDNIMVKPRLASLDPQLHILHNHRILLNGHIVPASTTVTSTRKLVRIHQHKRFTGRS